jgi:hypothetical protein
VGTKEETVLRNKSGSGMTDAGIGAKVKATKEEVRGENGKKGYGAESGGSRMGEVIAQIKESRAEKKNQKKTVK